jgi:YjbE family integral membrane protein
MNWAWIADIGQIIFADIILSGDNALVFGMAAASLAPDLRKKAIFIGMAMAAIMRICFAIVASHLMAIKGILIIGGCLLAWVCWRFYKDLKRFNAQNIQTENAGALATGPSVVMASAQASDAGNQTSFSRALFTILLADISMSIDNIVAVAAIARDDTQLLIFGLALAIAFMAFFASMIMKIMIKFSWLSYLGLSFLIYLTGMMLYDGIRELGEVV